MSSTTTSPARRKSKKRPAKTGASRDPRALPCPCGSPQSYRACCGRSPPGRRIGQRAAARHYLLYADACTAAGEGRSIHCLSALKALLLEEPLHRGGLNLLFQTGRQPAVFDREELQTIANAILKGYPDDPDLRCSAAGLLEMVGALHDAAQAYTSVLDEDATNFRALFGMGRVTHRRHRLDSAEYYLRQAGYAKRIAPAVLSELGVVLSELGRKDEAEHQMRIALALEPGNPAILLNLVRIEESRGNLSQAWNTLKLAASIAQGANETKLIAAILHRRDGNLRKSLRALEELDETGVDAVNLGTYEFERSKTLDRMGQYDLAFDSARKANAMRREKQGLRYKEEEQEQNAKHLREFFTKRNIARLPKPDCPGEDAVSPMFICGFTRSGTSMVEQILSSHSAISGGDELPFIYDLATNAHRLLGVDEKYPECLSGTHKDGGITHIQVLRQQYLDQLKLTGVIEPGVRLVTDKMPMNELHLGLIHVLFPSARIVHVVRHPLDSVLSSFFTDATHGEFCTYDIESAAKHYRLMFKMVDHYQKHLPLAYMRIHYEDIVKNVRTEVKRLLKFVDQPFEESCVEFQNNPRYARTASYAQVKESLYDTSVYRYRHYQKHLNDAVRILRPTIKRLGYEV